MTQRVLTNLAYYGELDADDRLAIEGALGAPSTVNARCDIVREASQPSYVLAIVAGWACQYKTLRNGLRQITSVLMPGDIDRLCALSTEGVDYGVATLTATTIAKIPNKVALQLASERPKVANALLRAGFAREAEMRGTILNLGRRSAGERLANQLSSIWLRAGKIGLIEEGVLAFPLSQADFADTMGITAVHLNRVLQRLRGTGLLEWRGGWLRVPDPAALARFNDLQMQALKLELVA